MIIVAISVAPVVSIVYGYDCDCSSAREAYCYDASRATCCARAAYG